MIILERLLEAGQTGIVVAREVDWLLNYFHATEAFESLENVAE